MTGEGWSMTVTHPDGQGPFPGVVILPGCSGNSPPAVQVGLQDHASALVSSGYAAAVLDVLGGQSICTDVAALSARERSAAEAARSAAERLAKDRRIDGKRIGFIGQSFGGSVALRLAWQGSPFAAIAAYYPWCASSYGGVGRSDFKVPVLIMTGTADTWTPVSRCQALKPKPGTAAAQIETYPDAVHSFDLTSLARQNIAGVGGSYPVGGDVAAATASRSHYLGFFAHNLR